MTNGWTDIDNSTFVLVWGANPAENHPACMAHVNTARAGIAGGKPGADMWVVDPRKTRTAMQAVHNGGRHIRIRPGTDIALANGVMREIMYTISGTYQTHYERFLNQSQDTNAFIIDDVQILSGSTATVQAAPNRPKYTDARFKVNSIGTDYQRYGVSHKIKTGGYFAPTTLWNATASRYEMWYMISSTDTSTLRFATSTDGVNWGAGAATDISLATDNDAPFVWLEGSTYYMVNTVAGKIALYDSTDGITWGTALMTDLLDPTGFTDTDAVPMAVAKVDRAMVLQDGANYRLYFQGKNAGSTLYKTYYTGSTAALPSAWVGFSGIETFPIAGWGLALSPAGGSDWDEDYVGSPMVVKVTGGLSPDAYHMLYVGKSLTPASMARISTAKSTDGTTWTRSNPGKWLKALQGVTDTVDIGRPVLAKDTNDNWSLWHHDALNNLYWGQGWWDRAHKWTGMPVIQTQAAGGISHPNSVYQRFKNHVGFYTKPRVATICGCSEADISALANKIIENSRCASYNGAGDVTALLHLERDARNAAYRATTILYAMGITQHTCGSQNVKAFAELQSLMGNMGRSGGGINALRGIHNVQGSTDMGVLKHLIPGYSNPPTKMTAGHLDSTLNDPNAFGAYIDSLWGSRLNGADPDFGLSGTYDNAYTWEAMDRDVPTLATSAAPTPGVSKFFQLQTKGFVNMTHAFFAPIAVDGGDGATTQLNFTKRTWNGSIDQRRVAMNALYDLWPKGNGDDHITMFRLAASGSIKAAYVVGQNPAVTEPNQVAIRQGLKELDLLVVQDMFLTETACAARKPGSVTYVLPVASHVEQAGSATNSGRCLQWRYQAMAPQGNSKTDLEYLLRFAKALDVAGAFSHIQDKWTGGVTAASGLGWALSGSYNATAMNFVSVYDSLYARPYGWTPGGAVAFDSLSGSLVHEGPVKLSGSPIVGAEYVAEKVYREICASRARGGTVWIYTDAYDSAKGYGRLSNTVIGAATSGTTAFVGSPTYTAWTVTNRSKSRSLEDPFGQKGYHKWGYSWLVNRRVLYSNNAASDAGGYGALMGGEVPGDQTDGFQGPDKVAKLFSPKNENYAAGTMDYATQNYRSHTYHKLLDVPSIGVDGARHSKEAGRFAAHTEPYETPYPALAAEWGYNSTAAGSENLVKSDTPRGTVADYPLVLTTIRCVEHFQGGPITRNNPANVEAEPYPWIEINSIDALNAGITDGDWVRVVTKRTEALAGDELAPYGSGFKARVQVGTQDNQRVALGVVAIPWHWGEKGLSTGSRANDLTIDAFDANTQIPEYKACLCRIVKRT